MELRTLQYFLTVAREENITRASEVLHITQPTLSRQMKQLEQESVTCADLLSVPLITPARLYVQKEISNWLGADINKLNVLATVNMMTHAAMFINSGAACGLTIEGAVDLFEDDKLAPPAGAGACVYFRFGVEAFSAGWQCGGEVFGVHKKYTESRIKNAPR